MRHPAPFHHHCHSQHPDASAMVDPNTGVLYLFVPAGVDITIPAKDLDKYHNIIVDGGGTLEVTGKLKLNTLSVTDDTSVWAHDGLSVHNVQVDFFGTIRVDGTFDLHGKPVKAVGDVSYLPGVNWFTGGTAYHNPANTPCFLAGVPLLMTDCEYRAVEHIQKGEFVMTDTGPQEVKWVGRQTMVVDDRQADDTTGHAIRIEEGALGHGLPQVALSVTADHCFAIMGYLVPARFLVNGRTIYYLQDLTTYDYYHIKFDTHRLVDAAGVQTESYHDTGHDQWFVDEARGPRHDLERTALPLATDPSVLFMIRSAVNDFIPQGATVHSNVVRPTEISNSLTFTTDDGRELVLCNDNPGKRVKTFRLPPNTKAIRMTCSAARPFDIHAHLDDRRTLGVRLSAWYVADIFEAPLIAFDPTADGAGWHEDGWSQECSLIRLPAKATHVSFRVDDTVWRMTASSEA